MHVICVSVCSNTINFRINESDFHKDSVAILKWLCSLHSCPYRLEPVTSMTTSSIYQPNSRYSPNILYDSLLFGTEKTAEKKMETG